MKVSGQASPDLPLSLGDIPHRSAGEIGSRRDDVFSALRRLSHKPSITSCWSSSGRGVFTLEPITHHMMKRAPVACRTPVRISLTHAAELGTCRQPRMASPDRAEHCETHCTPLRISAESCIRNRTSATTIEHNRTQSNTQPHNLRATSADQPNQPRNSPDPIQVAGPAQVGSHERPRWRQAPLTR